MRTYIYELQREPEVLQGRGQCIVNSEMRLHFRLGARGNNYSVGKEHNILFKGLGCRSNLDMELPTNWEVKCYLKGIGRDQRPQML